MLFIHMLRMSTFTRLHAVYGKTVRQTDGFLGPTLLLFLNVSITNVLPLFLNARVRWKFGLAIRRTHPFVPMVVERIDTDVKPDAKCEGSSKDGCHKYT